MSCVARRYRGYAPVAGQGVSTQIVLGTEAMIALAGGAGAVARYALVRLAVNRAVTMTLLINVAGSLLLGCSIGLMTLNGEGSLWLLAAGFCGGFTTFSSFALHVLDAGRDDRLGHRVFKANGLVVAHVSVCLIAVLFGWAIVGGTVGGCCAYHLASQAGQHDCNTTHDKPGSG